MHPTFFPYAKQSIDSSDIQAVVEALQQEKVTRGSKTEQFEEAVAGYVGAKWAVAFNSGTSALYAAFFAANVSSTDRFITTPNSFIATAGAGMLRGAKPQFVDIDRSSGNMNIDLLPPLFEGPFTRSKLVVAPVHFAGIALDMRRLERLIKTENSVIIEDAAHALGSKYPTGEMVGSCAYSQMTIFSFHPAKTITSGEGGMVTTNSDELYHRLLLFRNNGITRQKPALKGQEAPGYYEVQALTGNYHMTEMQAALGLSQLMRLHSMVEKRRALVQAYRKALASKPHIALFSPEFDERTAYHLLVAQIDFAALKTTRIDFMNKLREAGVGTDVHYIPIYRHPVMQHLVRDPEIEFPEMEKYYRSCLSLPLYYDLTEEDVNFICSKL